MANTFSSADQVVQAAAVAPGFSTLFAKSPAQVTYKGKTYDRSAVRNAQEQVWYLAAVAMTKPAAVASLAYAGYDSAFELDADHSGLDAAKGDLRTAEGALRKAQAQLASDKARLKAAEARVAAGFNFGQVMTGIATGGITAAYKVANESGQVSAFQDKVNEDEQAVTLARANVATAQATVDAEQTAYEEALKAQRKDEQDKRIKALQDKRDQAKADADIRAQQLADNMATKAQKDAAARNAAAQQATIYQQENQEPPIDYSGEISSDEVFGSSEWLDTDLMADVHGDEDYAEYAGEDSGELEGDSSPYSYKQYYGCDSEQEHFCPAGTCSQGWDTMEEAGYGLEPNIIMAIIAAILAIAPIIIGALMPPPAKSDSAENSGASEKTIAGQVATLTGADKLLQDAADRAGRNAKPDFVFPALILVAAYLLA